MGLFAIRIAPLWLLITCSLPQRIVYERGQFIVFQTWTLRVRVVYTYVGIECSCSSDESRAPIIR